MKTQKEIFWIDKDLVKIPLSEMTTSHLYHTVKMIWNNVIAPSHPFGGVRRWSFKFPHTQDFLFEFFNAGIDALKERRDNKIAVEFIEFTRKNVDRQYMKHSDEWMNYLKESFSDNFQEW